ncbi:alpha/beta fold hydrolase [Reichenbachiella sp. MALMAid0571]|uniref:YheT family hydrolase n=1 Tax=Reichenbachiella sp. MALMAid0571 TaxID=3143939 RepID=UPI0032DF319C
MPLISNSSYNNHSFYIHNGHFETIIPSLFREIKGIKYTRERIETPDDDFIDLDWLKDGNDKLIILSHGLEGSSDRHYVKSMAKYFHQLGWDVLAWNYRSCSGEINRALRMYHHGVTDDYDTMIQHALISNTYKKVVLSGFSMGGSTTLKYLGEKGSNVDPRILASAVFSVPCNLWDSALQLKKSENRFYRRRFLKKMLTKIKLKAEVYPDQINIEGVDNITTFDEFDERYTAPLHDFKDAQDFYTSSTSDQFYDNIKVPSLIVNAKNDPMLGNKCYPADIATTHPFLYLEIPKHGGHVGFSLKGKEHSWMDVRAYEFVQDFLN